MLPSMFVYANVRTDSFKLVESVEWVDELSAFSCGAGVEGFGKTMQSADLPKFVRELLFG
jgi:hypothetical protein